MDVQRMCIACRQRLSKQNLVRLVKVDNKLVVDNKRMLNGKGAYVCKNCLSSLSTKILNKVFRFNVSEENLINIKEVTIDNKAN